ncbi:MAG: class II aldolase/adducin family protein [Planctomycetota bacterium]|jgi:rhamnose utilization protein RhaD (predicted bifunctional aldolase and dehydrogenase)
MDKALADLIRISNVTGKDSTLVQGGGGNTSVKTADGEYMYIKASGTALKDMSPRKGWRRMRLDQVLSVIEDKTLAKLDPDEREPEVVDRLLLACDDNVKSGARPSVESHLHAALERCVIHLHPLAVAAYVNAKNGRALIEKIFRTEKFPPLWVPYTDPGFMLAKRIARLVESYRKQYGRKRYHVAREARPLRNRRNRRCRVEAGAQGHQTVQKQAERAKDAQGQGARRQ